MVRGVRRRGAAFRLYPAAIWLAPVVSLRHPARYRVNGAAVAGGRSAEFRGRPPEIGNPPERVVAVVGRSRGAPSFFPVEHRRDWAAVWLLRREHVVAELSRQRPWR